MTALYEILGVPFGFLLRAIYQIFPSYAVSIVLLTLITRLILIPSTIGQQKNTAKTQRMQSKIRKIQTKYQGNQQKIQEETTALYNREGYNPMNMGCAPLIFQFVILFGLIGAIYYPLSNFLSVSDSEIEVLKNALSVVQGKDYTAASIQNELHIVANISKIKELAVSDPSILKGVSDLTLDSISGINFKLFGGLSMGDIPKNFSFPSLIWIIPVLSFLSSLASGVYSMIRQKQTNPTMGKNPSMGCMTLGMPILSLVFVISYPAGIGVYWIASSLFGFITTVIIGQIYSPNKTLARVMVEETTERRSKEENTKKMVENRANNN